MAKAITSSQKRNAGNPSIEKILASDPVIATELVTPSALTPVPIVRFDAAFNPATGLGSVRISFNASQYQDFNNLSAPVFSAIIAVLRSGQTRYNGQYIIVNN